MLMRPSGLSLQSKIIIIIAATVISVLVVSSSIAMVLTRQLVEEEIYRKALAQARATAHQLVNEADFDNTQKLGGILRQIEHDFPSVTQADFYLHEPEHRLVATTGPTGNHLELDNVRSIENYNEFERPDEDTITIETPDGKFWVMATTIQQQGYPVACLNLKVSKSRSSFVTRNLVLQNLLVMLASLSVMFLVIHVFFLGAVRRPVKEMIRVMESAEGGQMGVRAEEPSRDEIGQLAGHLNRMLERLEHFRTELAGKVEEATAELAKRNEELNRINEELFETQKDLARSERLAVAGQLAASLAHEIGTPLNSISGHVQLLARRKTGDSVADRRLQIIESQIENIVRTVKQLLSWSRKFDLRIQPVDLRHILEESILLSSPALQLRKIKVRTELSKNFPSIYGDAGYLQQVFLNLVNNSMDAMPRGGELTIRLSPPSSGGSREVTIEVEDTGEGIPTETLAHIFEPMFTTKRMGTGAGLGLAICEQIVREHGGTIQVESELNRGTRFTIVLLVDCRERLEAAAGNPVVPATNSVE